LGQIAFHIHEQDVLPFFSLERPGLHLGQVQPCGRRQIQNTGQSAGLVRNSQQ
jgi:hypothetical protein